MNFNWIKASNIVNKLEDYSEDNADDHSDIKQMLSTLTNNPNSQFYFKPYGSNEPAFDNEKDILDQYKHYTVELHPAK